MGEKAAVLHTLVQIMQNYGEGRLSGGKLDLPDVFEAITRFLLINK